MKLKTPKNIRFLRLTALTLVMAMLALHVLFFFAIRREAMNEAQSAVADLLQIQSAIRNYVEKVLRPEAYRLQEQGILDREYFSPEMMSRSFVSQQMLEQFRKLQPAGAPEFVFRYAATSPLNLENLASAEEHELLAWFDSSQQQEFQQLRHHDDKDYLYYALALDRLHVGCLRCHGEPDDAPPSLLERYGRSHGFHRQLGELSGLMSITLDLSYYQHKGHQTFLLVSGLAALIFIGVFVFFWYLLANKDRQDQLLLEKNEELDRLSSVDTLTGVWNRLQLNREMDRAMAQANASRSPLAMILLDLDFFKRVNDSYGHTVGDQVLERFADFLRQACRKSDFIARFGGEEFVIVIAAMSEAELTAYAERLLTQMTEVDYPCQLKITASMGLAIMQPNETASHFFCRADRALYCSKVAGRFRYTLADNQSCSDSGLRHHPQEAD